MEKRKQPSVVKFLKTIGHDVYDFRNPKEGDNGFRWSDIHKNWEKWTVSEYLKALDHPVAKAGFKADFDAMQWAEVCVLVMPCGRSAHLEAGYFVGAKKKLIIYAQQSEPELMYKMANLITDSLDKINMELGPTEINFE